MFVQEKILTDNIFQTDIDECVEGTAQCDDNASCNNTIGSYNCSCNSGYEGTGFEGNCSSKCTLSPSEMTYGNSYSYLQT